MMAHELLRQAAQILGAGWSKGASARDATGRIVPLWAELLRQAAQILGAGWSKGSNARDATGRIVPLWAELLRQAAQILGAAAREPSCVVPTGNACLAAILVPSCATGPLR